MSVFDHFVGLIFKGLIKVQHKNYPKKQFSLSFLLASCMHNKTVLEQCGEENSCSGTFDNYICICNGYGYKLDDDDNQICAESKQDYLPFSSYTN